MNRTLLLTIALLFITFLGNAQLNTINPDLLKKQWPANWISCPGISQREYGVYHFRKSFSLDKKPDHYIIHISADNRYRLWVNGTAVCSGPARGDLYNWYFETVDLSPYLQQGRNTIAVQVWNLAIYAPTAQVSSRTGLIIQGDEAAQAMVNTDETWKVVKDEAYTPCALEDGSYHREVGAGDHVNGSAYPWDWQQVNYPDEKWLTATSSYNGLTFGNGGTANENTEITLEVRP